MFFCASITKAEFDSALADFNARLTTFEAGINSKIDSQVSSYLDRNGIWNGKKQTMNTGTISNYSLGNVTPTSATYANNWKLLSKNNWLMVNKVNKTGLACINYSFLPRFTYNEFFVNASSWSSATIANGLTAACSLVWVKKWYASDYTSTCASTNMIASVVCGAGTMYWTEFNAPTTSSTCRLYYPLPWGSGSVYGFVSTNDNIYFGLTHVGSVAWYGASTVSFGAEGNFDCTTTVTIY